jgi:hypothetical protein
MHCLTGVRRFLLVLAPYISFFLLKVMSLFEDPEGQKGGEAEVKLECFRVTGAGT